MTLEVVKEFKERASLSLRLCEELQEELKSAERSNEFDQDM
jgi:hypothetical protein